MKYTQKAIMIVSETGKDCGFIPMVHGIYTSKAIANRELDKAKKLPADLSKNVKRVEISFDFEI